MAGRGRKHHVAALATSHSAGIPQAVTGLRKQGLRLQTQVLGPWDSPSRSPSFHSFTIDPKL